MKTVSYLLVIMAAAVLIGTPLRSQDGKPSAQKVEYAFIRWDGFNNSHVIYPNNEVVMMGPRLKKLQKPNGVDERHFYQTAMMNDLAKEGWQFLSFFHEDVIMQRIK